MAAKKRASEKADLNEIPFDVFAPFRLISSAFQRKRIGVGLYINFIIVCFLKLPISIMEIQKTFEPRKPSGSINTVGQTEINACGSISHSLKQESPNFSRVRGECQSYAPNAAKRASTELKREGPTPALFAVIRFILQPRLFFINPLLLLLTGFSLCF